MRICGDFSRSHGNVIKLFNSVEERSLARSHISILRLENFGTSFSKLCTHALTSIRRTIPSSPLPPPHRGGCEILDAHRVGSASPHQTTTTTTTELLTKISQSICRAGGGMLWPRGRSARDVGPNVCTRAQTHTHTLTIHFAYVVLYDKRSANARARSHDYVKSDVDVQV